MTFVFSQKPSFSGAVSLLRAAGLPTEDLTEQHCEHFYYSGRHSEPESLVGLELFGEVALLRSLAVAEFLRGKGTGGALLAHAEEQARRAGIRRLYLLTTTAERFFLERGFVRASRESAPDEIRATREFAGICPASSSFLVKTL